VWSPRLVWSIDAVEHTKSTEAVRASGRTPPLSEEVLHVLDLSISWDFTSFEEHTSSKCGGILAGELSIWKACAIELVEKVPPGATTVNTVARTLLKNRLVSDRKPS